VVDLAYDRRNIENVVALARDADQLFIEAPFLDGDADIAAERWHLTARKAGHIRQTSTRRPPHSITLLGWLPRPGG
jgi:ribonuclease Z